MWKLLISVLLTIFISQSYAVPPRNKPLSPDKAFDFSVYLNEKKQLILHWKIAPGFYLYRDHIKVTSLSNQQIGKLQLPPGHNKTNEVLGTFQVYYGDLSIPVTFASQTQGILTLRVNYQGCASQGFCYPPMQKDVRINTNTMAETKNVMVTSQLKPATKQQYAESIFENASITVIILTFLGLGLLLAFTPCVLPMIPILSGIILGHKHITTTKAFLLSLAYVLGMAITYAIAGIFVALIGSRIQTVFQSAWAIVFVSGLFVLLSFSLFGFYELELPSRWTRKLTTLSNQQKGGTYFGVFLMGVLSSLIISPCVSAPLVGVLAYIANSGNVVLGGFALLALGIGMGIPLLLVGVSAGKFLPKSGPWMESIKKFFGVVLLGMAIVMLSRIIPGPLSLLLWAALLIGTAIGMGVFSKKRKMKPLVRLLAFILLIYGAILAIGGMVGSSDPMRPWEGANRLAATKTKFITLKNMSQLDEILGHAKLEGKPVLLDFYADWCTSCIGLDRNVFSRMPIQDALSGFILLRADITQNNDFDKALLKRFNVIAPPTILFFSVDGKELTDERLVGEISDKEFFGYIKQLN